MKQSTRFATLAAATLLIFSRPAAASLNLTGVTFPLIEIEAVAALILAALAGVWVINKIFLLTTEDALNVLIKRGQDIGTPKANTEFLRTLRGTNPDSSVIDFYKGQFEAQAEIYEEYRRKMKK